LARALHWFRNDLRLRDNTALDALALERYRAARAGAGT